MINRVFFISDSFFRPGDIQGDGNVFFSILVNPSVKENLEEAYKFMGDTGLSPCALTLNMDEGLSEESIKFITSFLFLQSYLRFEYSPVINILCNRQELLEATTVTLSDYIASQGIDNIIINKLRCPGTESTNGCRLYDLPDELLSHYKKVLQSDQFYDNAVFFKVSSLAVFQSVLTSLQDEEIKFRKDFPGLYSLANDKISLEKEITSLKRKIAFTEVELIHQKQHNEILRSDHSTKALQDYYDHEYEILPAWYKRFGHILKVITGKRTFRSLFRDDVKKYKD